MKRHLREARRNKGQAAKLLSEKASDKVYIEKHEKGKVGHSAPCACTILNCGSECGLYSYILVLIFRGALNVRKFLIASYFELCKLCFPHNFICPLN